MWENRGKARKNAPTLLNPFRVSGILHKATHIKVRMVHLYILRVTVYNFRLRWNVASCDISSWPSLFAKVPILFFKVLKDLKTASCKARNFSILSKE